MINLIAHKPYSQGRCGQSYYGDFQIHSFRDDQEEDLIEQIVEYFRKNKAYSYEEMGYELFIIRKDTKIEIDSWCDPVETKSDSAYVKALKLFEE